MQEEKQVVITNGSGTAELLNGSYDVTANVNGYDNTTINPSNVVVTDDTLQLEFKISATGTLTINVNETGALGGTPVVGATFVRCDSNGNSYGEPVVSDIQGNAIFNNVPYSNDGNITIYYKQTASDGQHNFSNALISVIMTNQSQTEQIQNKLPTQQTIKLTDLNYENLPVDSGTINFNIK